MAKPVLMGEDEAAAAEVRDTAAHVLGTILRLLHPVIPFVTETIWDDFRYGPALSLISAAWPHEVSVHEADAARAEIEWVIRFITGVRTVRAEMNVPPSVLCPVLLRDASPETMARARAWADVARRMGRMSEIGQAQGGVPAGSRSLFWTRRRWCCRWPASSIWPRNARALRGIVRVRWKRPRRSRASWPTPIS